MHFFKDIEVWKLSMDLIVDIYKTTDTFPAKEQFGMISRMFCADQQTEQDKTLTLMKNTAKHLLPDTPYPDTINLFLLK
ncbi:MAG TPA: four helix bundle protein [Bacteroidales bacterium]|mgnify:CR=1 FL=1|nr:four helix bundle protein [Bacteroidales bacterium]